MRAGSRAAPLELFFAHMGWNEFVRLHREFPLVNWKSELRASDWHVGIGCTDERTGEIVMMYDPSKDFPSATLITAFRLLAGNISSVLDANEKRLGGRASWKNVGNGWKRRR